MSLEAHAASKSARKQKGASMIEYALILAAVVAIATAFFASTSGSEGSLFTAIKGKLQEVVDAL